MKLNRTLAVLVACGTAAISSSWTQAAGVQGSPANAAMGRPSDNRNAALYYWRAFYSLDREFQRSSGELLVPERTADWRPADSIIAKLKENTGFLNQLLVATTIDKCDFGIAYDEGFMALLPHLGLMRSSSRILVLDAYRLMGENNPDAAAERLAAIFRMSVHLRNDRVLISSLVSIAMGSLASRDAELFAEAGLLTETGRDAILNALQPLNQSDGYGTKQCIETERRLALDYLRKVIRGTGPEAGKKVMEACDMQATPEQSAKLKSMDEAAVGASLDQMEPVYAEMLAAWDEPESPKTLKEIARKMEEGGYGLLAQLVAPSLGNARASDAKAARDLDHLIQTLLKAKLRQPGEQPAAPRAAPQDAK